MNTITNTDSEKIKKIAEQNRNRQKTYYQAHKQEILQKKAIEREQIREINLPPPPPEIIPSEFTLDMIYSVLNDKITNKNTKLKYCLQ